MDTEQLKKLYAIRLADYELTVGTQYIVPPEDEDMRKMFDYFTSTANRKHFGIMCSLGALRNDPVTATEISNRLNISRQSVDTMIAETSDAGWTIVEKDTGGTRRIKSNAKLVGAWMRYADAVGEYVRKEKFESLHTAITVLQATSDAEAAK